ncbi:MAG: hypothetical protein JXR52_10885 [Bacteroidales bacterium]|nr:hypothetical protein [Bacteroidales bacterium]
MKKIAILLSVLMMISCEDMEYSDIERANLLSDLAGTWVEEGYEKDLTVMERAGMLDPEKYGFIIEPDGSFTERKNASWSDAGPKTYADFEGEWIALSDSLLEITVDFWGGTMVYYLQIVFLEQDLLKVRFDYRDGED